MKCFKQMICYSLFLVSAISSLCAMDQELAVLYAQVNQNTKAALDKIGEAKAQESFEQLNSFIQDQNILGAKNAAAQAIREMQEQAKTQDGEIKKIGNNQAKLEEYIEKNKATFNSFSLFTFLTSLRRKLQEEINKSDQFRQHWENLKNYINALPGVADVVYGIAQDAPVVAEKKEQGARVNVGGLLGKNKNKKKLISK